jgi:hypothetical protein
MIMPFDICPNCGKSFIQVREQEYSGYIVPVLKCTTCNTVFGVANQSDEIENIKIYTQNLMGEIDSHIKNHANVINKLMVEVDKLKKEINNIKK